MLRSKPRRRSKRLYQSALSVGHTIQVPLKYVSLGVLIVQTTTLVLTLRYSRTKRGAAGNDETTTPMYLASTAVFVAEIMKMLASMSVVWKDVDWKLSGLATILRDEVCGKPRDMIKLSVPGILYTLQNNLLFLALSLLDAATYQVARAFFRTVVSSIPVLFSLGDVSAKNSHDSLIFRISSRQEINLSSVDFSCYSHGRRGPGSGTRCNETKSFALRENFL